MEIKLLNITPIELIITGIRACYESQNKSDSYYETLNDYSDSLNMYKSIESFYRPKFKLGEKDKALIERIIKSGHLSTLEHSSITFLIEGFSRDVLQEFSRHRVGVSPSVKSTRYTLSELKNEESFAKFTIYNEWEYDKERACKYIVFTNEKDIDGCSIQALENVRQMLIKDYPNDKVKYCLPGAYKTSGQYTFNFRSLRHLLELRTSPRALWEFRELAYKLYEAIPEEYKFLLEDCVHKEKIDEQ